MSLKHRFFIFHFFMALGAICAAVDIIYDAATGFYNKNLPVMIILACVFFFIAIVIRFTLVKCPHCGDKLIGHKGMPEKCPVCGTLADKKL